MRAITSIKERGAEFAEVDMADAGLRATGVAVSGDPIPYRLEYELDAGELGGAGELASLIHFQSGEFSADIAFDAQGLVADYPQIGLLA